MSNLTSRAEFRAILKGLVKCLKQTLDKPQLPPLTPEEIHLWLHEVTLEDVRVVLSEMETDKPAA